MGTVRQDKNPDSHTVVYKYGVSTEVKRIEVLFYYRGTRFWEDVLFWAGGLVG